MTDEDFRALVLEAFKVLPTGDYHYPFAPNQLRYLVAQAVEAEREACAKLADEFYREGMDYDIGAAIRARKQKVPK
jgi:hypothetical protein